MLVAVVMVSELLGTIDTLRRERDAAMRRIEQLKSRLDAHLLERLLSRGVWMRSRTNFCLGLPCPRCCAVPQLLVPQLALSRTLLESHAFGSD